MKATIGKSNYLALQAKLRNQDNRYFAIHQFRGGVEHANFFELYQKLFPLQKSLQDYSGNPFPKQASQIFSNKVPKNPVTAYREILWAISRCHQFKTELKDYHEQRLIFEKAVLLNNYEQAYSILNDIEGKFGKSVWLYQNRMATAYIAESESWPSEIAAITLEEVRSNKILHLLLHYVRRRLESATLRDKLREEIDGQVSSAIYSNYLRAKILDITDSSEAAVSSLLFVDSQASIIDHYCSLVLVLQAAVSDKMLTDEMMEWLLPPLIRLYDGTKDHRLLGVISAMGRPLINTSQKSLERIEAIECYTNRDYEACAEKTRDILEYDPTDSAIRLLRVKAEVALMRRSDGEAGIRRELEDHFFNILSANENFFSSVHALMVLSDRFSDHQWMLYFRAAVWYEIGAEEIRSTPSWMRDIYVREKELSPFAALVLKPTHASGILAQFEKCGRCPNTINLVKQILAGAVISSTIDPRTAKYLARELLSKKNYEDAANFYEIAAKGDARPAAKLRSWGGQSLALMLKGDHKQSLDIIVSAFLKNQHAPLLLPIAKLVELLPDADQWPNTINLSLMLALAGQLDVEGDLSKIRLAFEKFCMENVILKPSQLVDRIDEFGQENVIAYLDNVWQPEIMRQTLLYMRPEQIDEARIEACQCLVKIDPSRARTHKEELASRIKQQEIAKATALVEQSRVYVDIEAIKRALRTRLKTSYSQYKNSISQHGKQHNELLEKLQSALEGFGNGTSLPILLSSLHIVDGQDAPTQSDILFSSLFGEITKEFLIGDHGLNAYLSTRVRHGKFVDALRKSVADEHLVTARQDDGTYVPNSYWKAALSGYEHQADVLEALHIFSVKYDSTLFYVRDKRIQIRTYYDLKALDENIDGLFTYQFSSLERQLMQSYDTDFKDFDELIVKCVNSLWEKTDSNLAEVRNYLTVSLRSELMRLFDQLEADIASINHEITPPGLLNSIARSRTAVQQSLDSIVGWFKRSEVYDRQDFDIDFPCHIAANMMNRTLSVPIGWTGPNHLKMEADGKVPGRALDALVDIFYVLFENAFKYADSENMPLKIDVSMSINSGDLKSTVSNIAKPPTKERLNELSSLRSSLSTQESRRLAQNEGRSGFRKILLALSSPLYKSSFLDFEHTEEGEFKVNFGFKILETI
ncbi:hypothetical protein [Delftia acidovorans]|uniref:hypothetical protein n=1 Tax=Delftia acidovorans TaxID=80866 RepID=UPI002FDE80C0